MGRKFCITEEQYNMALKEGVMLNADVSAAGGDVKRAVDTTKSEAEKQGVKDYTVAIDGKQLSENKLITKKELQENRLKVLKENSEVYSVKDFIKKFK